MSMLYQRLLAFLSGLRTNIKKNPKLLFAAVILFALFWGFWGPIASLDKLAVLKMAGVKQTKGAQNYVQATRSNQTFLSIDTPFLNDGPLTKNQVLGVISQVANSENCDNQALQQKIEEENPLCLVQNNAFMSTIGPLGFSDQASRDEIVYYVVQEGDTLSDIADYFGLNTNTILWSNKLKSANSIKPGNQLVILPVNGLVHTVAKGENIISIASKYKTTIEKIIEFNDLPADGQISINDQLIVPDGIMPVVPKIVAPSNKVAKKATPQRITGPGTGKSRAYPYGQCTWYVAQKRYVPWSGHAKSWLANAEAMGFSVCRGSGCEPVVGAIISFKPVGSWLARLYGHVAYVESVSDGQIFISEMNHAGWAIKSTRSIPIGYANIAGFIY